VPSLCGAATDHPLIFFSPACKQRTTRTRPPFSYFSEQRSLLRSSLSLVPTKEPWAVAARPGTRTHEERRRRPLSGGRRPDRGRGAATRRPREASATAKTRRRQSGKARRLLEWSGSGRTMPAGSGPNLAQLRPNRTKSGSHPCNHASPLPYFPSLAPAATSPGAPSPHLTAVLSPMARPRFVFALWLLGFQFHRRRRRWDTALRQASQFRALIPGDAGGGLLVTALLLLEVCGISIFSVRFGFPFDFSQIRSEVCPSPAV
jgi:hypothetical protein